MKIALKLGSDALVDTSQHIWAVVNICSRLNYISDSMVTDYNSDEMTPRVVTNTNNNDDDDDNNNNNNNNNNNKLLLNAKTNVMPITAGATSSLFQSFQKYLDDIPGKYSMVDKRRRLSFRK
jgi:hypothetical protein